MSILNIVECESYQIKVKSPDTELSDGEIMDEYWKQGSHNPIQLGGEFDTYEQALAYAKECAEHDYPTCQRLMHGGYVICGNIYMAESTDMEDGEVMDYLDSEYITKPYKKDNEEQSYTHDTIEFANRTLEELSELNNKLTTVFEDYQDGEKVYSLSEYRKEDVKLISRACDVIEQLIDIVEK